MAGYTWRVQAAGRALEGTRKRLCE